MDANEMFKQGRLLKANMNREDAQFIFSDINSNPLGFKDYDSIAFFEWRDLNDRRYVAFYVFNGLEWDLYWAKLHNPFGLIADCYLVRRIS